ncbi:MBOAT family O-acyltransferase [Eisenbergiella porci]|uniref:MBOAT family O-acyltransferase n=1 Tax=Eisenbergiella porci TaxID=2652274 RepID=UPI002A831C68|nr:MBOAT family O-acyltransferase [Eisenbergiella porci]
MIFTSIAFLFYFLPVLLILYYSLGLISIRLRNALLLVFSFIFYAWGEPRNIILLVGCCATNWLAAILISKFGKYKKLFLIFDCMANLGILFLFKYLNFTVGSVNGLLSVMGGKVSLSVPELLLPIGISFFTLQALSYVIDVYRGDAKVQKNPFYVALYIAMFPKVAAGPVVQYKQMENQIIHRVHTWEKFEAGIVRFVCGLGKKLLLADTFAIVADNVYAMTMAGHQQMKIPMLLAWLGSFAYTLQIFYDFSAYSDMALGLGNMFGFSFTENFNYPYISKSFSEFWRRWHISLSDWFRDYVYTPLGGSSVDNADVMVRNLLIVWILTGLWHGAAWTFILWGLYNFALILLERLFKYEKNMHISSAWKHVFTLFLINFGWVLFRSENLYQYKEFMGNLFGLNHNGFYNEYLWLFLKEYAIFWGAGLLFCIPIGKWVKRRLAKYRKVSVIGNTVIYPICMTGLFIICIMYLVKRGSSPFIYFNF